MNVKTGIATVVAFLLTTGSYVQQAPAQAVTDDAESYTDFYVGVNGGGGTIGWAGGFDLKDSGLSNGGAFLESEDAISGNQSFGLGTTSVLTPAGAAVSRLFATALSITRELTFLARFSSPNSVQMAGVSVNHQSVLQTWNDAQRLFVGVSNGVWQVNGTNVTKGGAAYAAASQDVYAVSVTVDPNNDLFEVTINNTSDATQGSSDLMRGNLLGKPGAAIESVGFALITQDTPQEFVWDDINVSDPMAPLPVELTAFDATRNEGATVLRWRTASETNNAGFEVQRATTVQDDAPIQWEMIGFVEGHGTTTEAQIYRFEDAQLPFDRTTLHYRLKQIDFDGAFEYSPIVEVDVEAPERIALHGNYPNPFNPRTTIRYELSRPSHVMLNVYDVTGQEVATLLDRSQEAGRHEVPFDAQALPSGVYLYRLQAADFTETRRMLLVK